MDHIPSGRRAETGGADDCGSRGMEARRKGRPRATNRRSLRRIRTSRTSDQLETENKEFQDCALAVWVVVSCAVVSLCGSMAWMSDESASEWEGSGAEDASDDDFASAKPAKRERPAAVAQEQQNPQKFAKAGTKTPTSSNSAVSGSSGAKKSVQSTPTTANAKGSAAAMKVSSSLASVPLSGDANSEGSPPKTSAASTGSGQAS
eukprot:6185048-Pleurochrysis_carterae.AAC.1